MPMCGRSRFGSEEKRTAPICQIPPFVRHSRAFGALCSSGLQSLLAIPTALRSRSRGKGEKKGGQQLLARLQSFRPANAVGEVSPCLALLSQRAPAMPNVVRNQRKQLLCSFGCLIALCGTTETAAADGIK